MVLIKAGVLFVMVNPAYTSTDCSSCGHRQPMPLEVRVYECPQCGLVMCRDRNSAINVSVRGMKTLGSGGTASRRSSAIQAPDVRPGSPPGRARRTGHCRTVSDSSSLTAVNYSL